MLKTSFEAAPLCSYFPWSQHLKIQEILGVIAEPGQLKIYYLIDLERAYSYLMINLLYKA